MILKDVPLSVWNRALELYGQDREQSTHAASEALISAESRIDVTADLPGITPFAQAVAEYISLSGPWAEDGGEYAGQSGYSISV